MADARLKNAASHLLTTLAPALEAEGITVPSRRYIHSGLIAHDFAGEDCASGFVVAWTASFQGTVTTPFPAGEIRCQMPLTAQFEIALYRCVPGLDKHGKPPSAAALSASAEEILTDAMTLAKVVVDRAKSGDLLPTTVQIAGIGQVSAIGPLGNIGGTVLSLLATLLD